MEIKSDKERAEIVSLVKILLRLSGTEKDTLLDSLLEMAYSVACAMTGRDEIPSALLAKMVCEDYSRPNGVSGVSLGSAKESYLESYSKDVLAYIKSLRRLKAV